MTTANPFRKHAPAPPAPKGGLTKADRSVIVRAMGDLLLETTQPLIARIEVLEAALDVERERVTDTIRTVTTGYLGGSETAEESDEERATRAVKEYRP